MRDWNCQNSDVLKVSIWAFSKFLFANPCIFVIMTRDIRPNRRFVNMGKEVKDNYTIQAEELGEVQIADEVVAIIAGLAAMEVDGVASMAGNATRELVSKLGMKSLSKGVKVDVLEGVVTVALALNLKYGYSIMDITSKVQEKVKTAIENMTGLTVADVNIRVAGVDMPTEE